MSESTRGTKPGQEETVTVPKSKWLEIERRLEALEKVISSSRGPASSRGAD